jgi:hypothetical protein
MRAKPVSDVTEEDALSHASEIGRASRGRRAYAGSPAMLPCIGFAQASAGDVNHPTQRRCMVNGLAWYGEEGRGKLR